jgi:hypothetical protein
MLEDIEKCIGDVVGFRVENILYLYIYKPRIIGSIGRTWGTMERPPKMISCVLKN